MWGYRFIIIDKQLFIRKFVMLVAFSAGLIPLILYKNEVGTLLYVGALLVLHAYVLAVYLWRVSWRAFLKSKRQFAIRLLGILFFSWLLSLLRSGESIGSIVGFLCISAFLHVMLLLLFMVKVESVLDYERARAQDDEN